MDEDRFEFEEWAEPRGYVMTYSPRGQQYRNRETGTAYRAWIDSRRVLRASFSPVALAAGAPAIGRPRLPARQPSAEALRRQIVEEELAHRERMTPLYQALAGAEALPPADTAPAANDPPMNPDLPGHAMTTKTLPPTSLTVDALIVQLQRLAGEGLGSAQVEALVGGSITLPVCGTDTMPAWGTPTGLTVLLQLDDDAEVSREVVREQGRSLAGA